MESLTENFIVSGNSQSIFIMAHGAGAPMDHEWMNQVCDQLVQKKIKVYRFNFPYMQQRALTGKKRPPNSKKILLESYKEAIEQVALKEKVSTQDIFIGGKSMGGRMASLIADEQKVAGLICLGFPFHAPGKDVKDRIVHLEKLKTKTIILQGERDSMGNREEVQGYSLSSSIQVKWLEDGDHGLKPRKKSGHTLEENLNKTAQYISDFINKTTKG